MRISNATGLKFGYFAAPLLLLGYNSMRTRNVHAAAAAPAPK